MATKTPMKKPAKPPAKKSTPPKPTGPGNGGRGPYFGGGTKRPE